MSDFAIRCSAGWRTRDNHEVGGRLFAQRAIHALAALQSDPHGAIAGRDAGARLEQRLEDLLTRQPRGDIRQVRTDIRSGTADGVASGTRGRRVLDKRRTATIGAPSLQQRVTKRQDETRRRPRLRDTPRASPRGPASRSPASRLPDRAARPVSVCLRRARRSTTPVAFSAALLFNVPSTSKPAC